MGLWQRELNCLQTLLVDIFEANDKGEWSYITSQGEKLTGFQYVDGVELYFDKDGKQLKGQEITVDGKTYYLDHNTGALLKNSLPQLVWKTDYPTV